MTGISEQTIKKLFALSQNRCAFHGCTTAIVQASGALTGKICHIKARSPGGPRYDPTLSEGERNGFENLILLCSVHHDIVDQEPHRYTADLLKDIKGMHERNGDIEMSLDGARMARKLLESYVRIEASGEAQVMVGSPGAIQAKTVNIKTSRKNPPVPLPTDAIGNNIEMRAYADYLIKRYIEWRLAGVESGKDKRRFHPSMIRNLIEREFGARSNLIPQREFSRLVRFLQDAIDETIQGRMRRHYGKRNYHGYEEHLDILHGRAESGTEE